MATVTSDLSTSVLHFSGTYTAYQAIISTTATSGDAYTNKQAVLNGIYICTDEANAGRLFVKGVEVKDAKALTSVSDYNLESTLTVGDDGTITIKQKNNNTSIGKIPTLSATSTGYGLVSAEDWGDYTSRLETAEGNIADVETTANNAKTATETNASAITAINNAKGAKSGIATLDSSGKVPVDQLPSYVSDVIEGYSDGSASTNSATTFYSDKEKKTKLTGETNKIYVDLNTNKTYRWGGSQYTEISASIALGTDANTAYAGDKGKQNADDIATLKTEVANLQSSAGDKSNIADRVTFTQPTSTTSSALTAQLYNGTTKLGTSTTVPVATTTKDGVMSATDKTNLEASLKSLGTPDVGDTTIVITPVKTDGTNGDSITLPAAIATTSDGTGKAGLLTASDKQKYELGLTTLGNSLKDLKADPTYTTTTVAITAVKNNTANTAETVTIKAATSDEAGVMSAKDKALLDAIGHWWTASE